MGNIFLPKRVATYTRMADGTQEDYLIQQELGKQFHVTLADRVLEALGGLRGNSPNLIDRYEHSLQTATRAFRDGADEEMVVAALLHDIGDLMAPDNHAAIAAQMLRPYVTPLTFWIIEHHGIFQGYYFWHYLGKNQNAREEFRDHPYFQQTVEFCHKWDQESFDPAYDTMPLSAFEPMVRRIFDREPWGEHTRPE